MEAEIKLLHVFEHPAGDLKMQSNATFESFIVRVAREAEERAKEDMVIFTERIKRHMAENQVKGVFIHSAVAMGNIMYTMKSVCESYQPDLVVLGTQGKREGEGSMFSGVARELLKGLRIPLFAVPGACSRKQLGEMNILYATDFNENDHSSLDQLLKIMEPFDTKITCIHIDTAHNPTKEERMDELNAFLANEYGHLDIECRLIDYSNVYQGIKDYADSNAVNLLSFTIQKHGIFDMLFMPNLFKKILQEASIPILMFPS
jgi:nucleotide-binding universal stress UspA family protein